MMVFEIFREEIAPPPRRSARWRWRLMADSPEPIAFGCGYRSKAEAERAVAMVRHACSAETCLIISKA
jgi:uncharacterized protein YegP (UPF0339 family)